MAHRPSLTDSRRVAASRRSFVSKRPSVLDSIVRIIATERLRLRLRLDHGDPAAAQLDFAVFTPSASKTFVWPALWTRRTGRLRIDIAWIHAGLRARSILCSRIKGGSQTRRHHRPGAGVAELDRELARVLDVVELKRRPMCTCDYRVGQAPTAARARRARQDAPSRSPRRRCTVCRGPCTSWAQLWHLPAAGSRTRSHLSPCHTIGTTIRSRR